MIDFDELFRTNLADNLTLVEVTKAKVEILSYVGPCVGKLEVNLSTLTCRTRPPSMLCVFSMQTTLVCEQWPDSSRSK